MKSFHKIVFIVLALAPLMALLAFVVGNIGNDTNFPYVEMGSVSVSVNSNAATFACEADTWAERIITPLVGENAVGGFFGACGKFLVMLSQSCGITTSVPLVLCMFYIGYGFAIEILYLLTDFILFVPRKCKEVLR